MNKLLNNRPLLVAYVLILVGFVLAIAWQNHLGEQRKQQICYAEIEDRLLWKDTIDYLGQGGATPTNTKNLPPELQRLINESRKRSEDFYKFTRAKIEIPPKICNDTGIKEEDVRNDQIRRGVRANTTTTTTLEVG